MTENTKPCEKCKHCDQGLSHGYPWMTCSKNWSDKVNGVFYGVQYAIDIYRRYHNDYERD